MSSKNDVAQKRVSASLVGTIAAVWAACSKLATSSSPRKVKSKISQKAKRFRQKKRVGEEFSGKGGEEGVWQRNILMGDKCQPLDFSGVIYYDGEGNQINELPMKSPRASPLPSFAYKSEKW